MACSVAVAPSPSGVLEHHACERHEVMAGGPSHGLPSKGMIFTVRVRRSAGFLPGSSPAFRRRLDLMRTYRFHGSGRRAKISEFAREGIDDAEPCGSKRRDIECWRFASGQC